MKTTLGESFTNVGFVQSMIVPLPAGGVHAVGDGYNSLTGENAQFALQGQAPAELLKVDEARQSVIFRIRRIENKSSLYKELDFNTEASYGGLGSMEIDLVKNTAINSFSLNYLLIARVMNPPRIIASPMLSDQAVSLLKKRDYKNFYRLYGTHFYRSELRGGCLYGIVNIQGTDKEDTKTLRAKMNLGFGFFDSSAKLRSAVRALSSNASLSIEVTRQGGSPSLPGVYNTPEELEQAARDFTSNLNPTNESDWSLALRAESYRNCLNYPVEALDFQDLLSVAVVGRLDIDEMKLTLLDLNSDLQQANNDIGAIPDYNAWNDAVSSLLQSADALKASIAANPFQPSWLSEISKLRTDIETNREIILTKLAALRPPETYLSIPFEERLTKWRRIRGDREMDTENGEFTKVIANVEPINRNGDLFLKVEYRAQEMKGDRSTFHGFKEVKLQTPSNCQIIRLGNNNPLRYNDKIKGEKHKSSPLPVAGSFLRSASVNFDNRGGNDADDVWINLKGEIVVVAHCKPL